MSFHLKLAPSFFLSNNLNISVAELRWLKSEPFCVKIISFYLFLLKQVIIFIPIAAMAQLVLYYPSFRYVAHFSYGNVLMWGQLAAFKRIACCSQRNVLIEGQLAAAFKNMSYVSTGNVVIWGRRAAFARIDHISIGKPHVTTPSPPRNSWDVDNILIGFC